VQHARQRGSPADGDEAPASALTPEVVRAKWRALAARGQATNHERMVYETSRAFFATTPSPSWNEQRTSMGRPGGVARVALVVVLALAVLAVGARVWPPTVQRPPATEIARGCAPGPPDPWEECVGMLLHFEKYDILNAEQIALIAQWRAARVFPPPHPRPHYGRTSHLADELLLQYERQGTLTAPLRADLAELRAQRLLPAASRETR
jgi:hypothetical protein